MHAVCVAVLQFFLYLMNYLVVAVILACSCRYMFEQCADAAAVSVPDQVYSVNLRLDSKQLVSEFLQDTLSKKTR